MLKISLYHNFCSSLSVKDMNLNTYDYRKNQGYTTDRPTTRAVPFLSSAIQSSSEHR